MYLELVTILILIDGFLQLNNPYHKFYTYIVTILILIDGFLQSVNGVVVIRIGKSQSLF